MEVADGDRRRDEASLFVDSRCEDADIVLESTRHEARFRSHAGGVDQQHVPIDQFDPWQRLEMGTHDGGNPYRQYDHTTGTTGPLCDPGRPINESRANSGLREFPKALPAFTWYPYPASPDFPATGTSGRSAMAGPVFRAERYPGGGAVPGYYDGKLLIYDWIRNWMKVVTLTAGGDYEAMEPFLPGVKFAAPIDVELGPDGSLYVLEYGIGWFK